jgi:hypothetical protein
MEAHKLQIKLFATDAASALEQEAFIPVFHDWIKRQALPELVIDVVNYAHVPKGPGVGLIGHANDYAIDDAEGRRGLLYSRKRNEPAPGDRVRDAFRRTLFAAQLLEAEPALAGKLAFRTEEWLFRVNDRLAAKNDDATFAALEPELKQLGQTLFAGEPFALARKGSAKDLFTVTLRTERRAPLATLLDRLGGPPDRDASLGS